MEVFERAPGGADRDLGRLPAVQAGEDRPQRADDRDRRRVGAGALGDHLAAKQPLPTVGGDEPLLRVADEDCRFRWAALRPPVDPDLIVGPAAPEASKPA